MALLHSHGRSLQSIGQYEEANARFQEAVALDPLGTNPKFDEVRAHHAELQKIQKDIAATTPSPRPEPQPTPDPEADLPAKLTPEADAEPDPQPNVEPGSDTEPGMSPDSPPAAPPMAEPGGPTS